MYFRISLGLLLDGCAPGSAADETVGSRPLSSRLRDPGCIETRLVASRLLERISSEEFAEGVRTSTGGKVGPCELRGGVLIVLHDIVINGH